MVLVSSQRIGLLLLLLCDNVFMGSVVARNVTKVRSYQDEKSTIGKGFGSGSGPSVCGGTVLISRRWYHHVKDYLQCRGCLGWGIACFLGKGGGLGGVVVVDFGKGGCLEGGHGGGFGKGSGIGSKIGKGGSHGRGVSGGIGGGGGLGGGIGGGLGGGAIGVEGCIGKGRWNWLGGGFNCGISRGFEKGSGVGGGFRGGFGRGTGGGFGSSGGGVRGSGIVSNR